MTNPIDHLIVLMMENRSFDHFYGALALAERTDVDGIVMPYRSIPDIAGNPVANWCMDGGLPGFPDIPHDFNSVNADYDGGRNDGFVRSYQAANPDAAKWNYPMGYYTGQTLPALYGLADHFTVCDRWFASMLSSTWPNRKYFHSGCRDKDDDTHLLPGLLGFQTTPIYETIEDSVDPVTSLPLTWKCYYSDLPFLAFWYKFTAFHLRNFASVEMFVDDCRAGTLPSVSVIDPPFTIADDHPPHDPQLGEKFIGLIVDALTTSQSWENSALVILYDESGGFYDHVAPPAAPEIDPVDTPLGFRVPAVIVSPYSKKRASHTVFDHTSVLRSIADRWNIAFGSEFGTRWKFANPIWGEFDFTTPAKPGGIYSGSPLADLDWAKGVREQMSSPQGKFEGLLERIFVLPELKALDKRAEVFETLGRLEQKVITQKRMSLY